MPFFNMKCCNKPLIVGEVWFLNDIKNFTARKLFKMKCSVCSEYSVVLIEKRISDNKVFVNEIQGIEAVKTLYREKKRLVFVNNQIKVSDLFGWIYGVNKEIVNKKGDITQIRQYSCIAKKIRVK